MGPMDAVNGDFSDGAMGDDNESISPLPSPPPSPITSHAFNESISNPKQTHTTADVCKELLNNSKFSDCKIIVQGCTFYGHWFLLISRCPYFALMHRSQMREFQDSTINISDESPMDIYRVLSFIYTLEYRQFGGDFYKSNRLKAYETRGVLQTDDILHATSVNIRMCIIADKYDMPDLEVIACKKQTDLFSLVKIANSKSEFECRACMCRQIYRSTQDYEGSNIRQLAMAQMMSLNSQMLASGYELANLSEKKHYVKLLSEQPSAAQSLLVQMWDILHLKDQRINQLVLRTKQMTEDNERLRAKERQATRRSETLKEMLKERERYIDKLKGEMKQAV
ncbi:hypothetical protein BJ508DRAFT_314231 [Ascobolus immersus RN42]|uniref:BTB domain-containing protein n=1 Tax=Ascobolus immersus RN42 TaxID=1160509 RepID=A0A3N4HTH6_ASCIM|nr:hypothetical protein BJ508DRAFT_314231 [Ascobolus immersus RN42]